MARPFIAEYMEQFFDEVEPMEFYREIFPEGQLDPGRWNDQKQRMEFSEDYKLHHGTLIDKNVDGNHRRYSFIFDDLDGIRKAVEERRDALVAPVLYHGRRRTDENARFINAMCFDWDGVSEEKYLRNFFHQVKNDQLPMPTYIVCSGNGLHLYYCLDRPYPCFFDKLQELRELKRVFTRRLWNPLLTEEYEKPQYEAVTQAMRLVGGVTKDGGIVRAFETGSRISVTDFGEYVDMPLYPDHKDTTPLLKARLSWPDWYDRRIVRKEERKHWICNRGLYDRWLERIPKEAGYGHRYFALMTLSIFAVKSGVSWEELRNDAYELIPKFNAMSEEPFTESDVLAALAAYDESYIRYGRKGLEKITGCEFPRQKRNWQKQAVHLKMARSAKQIKKEEGLLKAPDGRPSKKNAVTDWQEQHPDGRKIDCIRETGLSKSTVYRHWNETEETDPVTAADLERIRSYGDILALIDRIPDEKLRKWYETEVTFEGQRMTYGQHIELLLNKYERTPEP